LRIGTARSVDLETGAAGRVQVPHFQCDAKCIGTNYFFNRRCPNAVYALRIEEISGISGAVGTQIVVEAETIFDVPANGIYYANLVVTGVPVIPPTNGNSAKLPNGPPPFD
jgi:hypothetical protein